MVGVDWRKPKNTAVQHLLDSFDALADADKHRVAVEILRRDSANQGDVTDAGLIEAADELFLALDAEEEAHAQR
jgi:hypothetical protein